ncbi:type II toxin-antitoxin system VapB family antitoxin [Skermanella mucosa]|uniref:type II toxin-antitoxin system VapB family antitoxin n=1 Tax=Skermanella mucosa TaxID=1789672 RepID=UPI00192AB1C8|nr:type II toxin-antitoxin system VapB family antitoxin [Skermanella mucosa]
MPLNNKDPGTEKNVHELDAVTGKAVTAARSGKRLADELKEIGARCSALPDLDTRSADEILGYVEHGLPR